MPRVRQCAALGPLTTCKEWGILGFGFSDGKYGGPKKQSHLVGPHGQPAVALRS